MEVANFCAAMDPLIDQDDVFWSRANGGVLNEFITEFRSSFIRMSEEKLPTGINKSVTRCRKINF